MAAVLHRPGLERAAQPFRALAQPEEAEPASGERETRLVRRPVVHDHLDGPAALVDGDLDRGAGGRACGRW
ncbi:hypothetical protein [Rhodococcus aerolatus]